MFKYNKKSQGQSLSEYVLIIALIAATLMGMQTFMKRSVQGVIRRAAQAIGDQKKGSIEEGAQGEIRTLPPGASYLSKVNTETVGATETVSDQNGKVDYLKNQTTTLEQSGGGQQPQQLNHEYIYNE